jgi:hypothetical protein
MCEKQQHFKVLIEELLMTGLYTGTNTTLGNYTALPTKAHSSNHILLHEKYMHLHQERARD